ncbi:MAG: integral membrane sensor hybrid histidine kinase, partial [Elusimicrobia bacterium]
MARILIVDDEPAIRELIATVLGMHGHACDMADGGVQALSHLQRKPYDLLIIDRNMPVMDGIQAVSALRAN